VEYVGVFIFLFFTRTINYLPWVMTAVLCPLFFQYTPSSTIMYASSLSTIRRSLMSFASDSTLKIHERNILSEHIPIG